MWTQLSGAPHFSDVSAAYDPVRHVIVVLGAAPEGVGTWTWDGSTWHFVTTSGPALPRANPAFCFDTSTGLGVLFGGAGIGTPIFGDTWIWNGTTWMQQQPVHNPPARFEAAISCGSPPLLFGGWGNYSGSALTDTWAWNGTDWRQFSTAHNPAVGTVRPFGIFDGSHQIVFVGMDASQIWTWTGGDWATAA